MAKKRIKDIIEDMVKDFLAENQLELYNVEFLKEGKDWFLRVYIDKTVDAEQEYVGSDDCEKVSRFLSEKLDEEDPIAQNYYLEVSSPGMDRPLLTEEHYRRYEGYLVDVKLYKGIDGTKNITGELKGLNDGIVTIIDEKEKTWELPLDAISKTRLAVVF
jgi:ribosome maturation factor RimP